MGARVGLVGGGAASNLFRLARRERPAVGLSSLSPDEDESFQRTNEDYQEEFGFPPVTAVRDHTEDTLPAGAESRLKHSREREPPTSIVEVVKIANFRPQDMVEESLVGAKR